MRRFHIPIKQIVWWYQPGSGAPGSPIRGMMYSKKQQAGYFSKKNKRSVKISNADKWFSKFVRVRDTASVTADGVPMARCITCGKLYDVVHEMDAGHFIKRDRKGTRFNEKNCHAQCKRCNNHRSGEEFAHALAIDRLYGKGTAERLYALGSARCRLTKDDLDRIADEYRNKTKALATDKGIKLW